jgi:hypothetical protein
VSVLAGRALTSGRTTRIVSQLRRGRAATKPSSVLAFRAFSAGTARASDSGGVLSTTGSQLATTVAFSPANKGNSGVSFVRLRVGMPGGSSDSGSWRVAKELTSPGMTCCAAAC